MKSFPFYIQHNVMDCGPTCLRMVSAYYGKHYSLGGLREKSFITREVYLYWVSVRLLRS